MNVLFYMDPLVDLLDAHVNRSFSTRYDLCAQAFANGSRKADSKDSFKFFLLDGLAGQRDIKAIMARCGIEVHTVTGDEILNFTKAGRLTLQAVVGGRHNVDLEPFTNFIKRIFQKRWGDWTPDMIIGWERVPDYVSDIYPEALILEGNHSAFFRLEQRSDILYNIKTKKYDYGRLLKEDLFYFTLPDDIKDELEQYRNTFKKYLLEPLPVERSLVDPDNKFRKLIFYPGHYSCYHTLHYKGYTSDQNFLNQLLKLLPDDCAILYTPHPLTLSDKHANPIPKNKRLIDLSGFEGLGEKATLAAVKLCDGLVNIASKTSFFAFLMQKPVFNPASSWQYSTYEYSGDLEELKNWASDRPLDGEKRQKYKELADKLLWYTITRTLPTSYLNTDKNSLQYFKSLLNSFDDYARPIDLLPQVSTVDEACFRLKQACTVLSPSNHLGLSKAFNQYEYIRGLIMSPEVEWVGFDIFDTLLQRPAADPKEIFEHLEVALAEITGCHALQFKHTRVLAEQMARQDMMKSRGDHEVTIDDIYDQFAKITDMTAEQAAGLRRAECDLEYRILYPRYSVRALFKLAQALGKKIVAASDMYLSSEFLRDVLHKNGYGHIERLYVSCEHKASKGNGELYDKVIKELRIEPHQMIFIGDNLKSDCEMPRLKGIWGVHYPKAMEIYKKTIGYKRCFQQLINTDYSAYTSHLGYVANTLFDNPFTLFDFESLANKSPYLIGFYLFGPLALSLSIWLAEAMKAGKYDKLLAFSRDGYMVQRIYELLNEKVYNKGLPPVSYFYISRSSAASLFLNKSCWSVILSLYCFDDSLTVASFLERYFGLEINGGIKQMLRKENLKPDDSFRANKISMAKLFTDNIDYFAEMGSQSLLPGYFLQEAGGPRDQKLASFNLGARASSERILLDTMNKSLDVFLFKQHNYKAPNNGVFNHYIKATCNTYRPGVTNFISALYELFLSNPYEGTCSGYAATDDGRIEPVIEDCPLSDTQMRVCAAQLGIKDFVADFINFYPDSVVSHMQDSGRQIFLLPLELVFSGQSDYELFTSFRFEDPLSLEKRALPLALPPMAPVCKGGAPAAGKPKPPAAAVSKSARTNKASEKKPSFTTRFKMKILGGEKKYNKYQRSPYMYWSDSRGVLRILRHFYSHK